MLSNGSYEVKPIVEFYKNGIQYILYYRDLIFSNLNITLYMYIQGGYVGENISVYLQITNRYNAVIFSYGASCAYPWPFSSNSYSAYTMIEAPVNPSNGELITCPW